jgi:negative regulator of sigma E activity
VTQEQVESQLSAMFDGQLPAAECELLSRRIDREEKLRARWSRYALIGAAMRSEPVATAQCGFAARVSAALDVELGLVPVMPDRVVRTIRAKTANGRAVWNTALAASMVVVVAGASIAFLRYTSPMTGSAGVARAGAAGNFNAASLPAAAVAATAATIPVSVAAVRSVGSGEPRSYVTPVNQASGMAVGGLQTQLADFMVAHSQYSSSLMRSSLLSALVANEDAVNIAPRAVVTSAGRANALPAASVAGR